MIISMSYDFNFRKIDDLYQISNNDKIHYEYERINFLFNRDNDRECDNLIVFFHGSVPQFSNIKNVNRIVFRGYNYHFDNADILSFSDGLMNVYSDYMIGWFLSTKKYNFDKIYREIMTYIFDKYKYKNILFTGTSGGGYPSIRYACYYNKHALISNSQLYLEKYNKKYMGFNKLKELVNNFDDEIIYESIEDIIEKNYPKKLIIYSNILDYTYYVDLIKFCKFISKKQLDKLEIINIELFEDCESDNKMIHQIQFPHKEKYINILEKTINTLK
jgi:hypothetical protein